MKIRNVSLKTIEARRYIKPSERPKQVRIDHNSSFTEVTYVKGEETLFDFQYTASYGPVGMIKLEGSLVYENDDAKKISDEWGKTRKVPNQTASHVHTAIMHACVPLAVGISKDLGLPPPIPLPQVKLGEKQKTGQAGPEFA